MLALATCLILLIFLALLCWHASDVLATRQVWCRLADAAEVDLPGRFAPELVAALPEPAQRYFCFTIEPGAPLHRGAEFTMKGEIGLGSKLQPNYMPMRGHQILVPPWGLVWRVSAGRGVAWFCGSDVARGEMSWTRFWLWGLLPVVRVGGNRDHARSALGRVVAESAFWAPASLLLQNGVSWQAVDANTARATFKVGGFCQSLELSVDTDGRPQRVVIQRWSNVNSRKRYQLQAFGGYLSEFKNFDGYCLATRIEGGNHIGSDNYFPFYKANITRYRFITGNQPGR